MSTASETPAERAKRANAELAAKIGRWKYVRLTAAVVFCIAGTCIIFFTTVRYAALPVFLIGGGLLFAYLEARDHQREVTSRNWKTSVPRIGQISPAEPKGEGRTIRH